MTEINNINGNAIVQKGQRQSQSPGTGFQNSLEIALAGRTTANAQSAQTAALSEPSATSHIDPAAAPSADEIVCQADHLLGLLESYASGLETPGATLKDLAPLVDRIRDGAQQLMDSAERSTSAKSELKAIASQAALTANAEYVKFQRGDYV